MTLNKAILLFLSTVLFCLSSLSQKCPPNFDFESGDFSSWECFVGTTYPENSKNVIDLKPSAAIAGRHQIITGTTPATKDPYGKFPTLCPYGGKYSVKLGNDAVGAEAEGISYTFDVPPQEDTFTITYFYAVVFQDPGHESIEQPRFFVTAYDVLSGELINCASYNYIATGSIPGFKKSSEQSDVLYKTWSPVSIQFIDKENRKVRLEFKTADCTQGGHFGYAYIDVGTGCSNILATAPYCMETNSIILNAPYGFQTYTWYDQEYKKVIGNLQSLTLSPPPATTGTFHVDMIPYPGFGCRDTADAIVTPLPVPAPPEAKLLYGYCQNEFTSELTATALPGNELLWYTDSTDGLSSFDAPIVPTGSPGAFYYYATQKVLFGCESKRTKIKALVVAKPVASFSINQDRQCQNGNNFVFTNNSSNLSVSTYTWDFGDNTALPKDSNAIYNYKNFGNFTVKLTVLNEGVCATDATRTLTVVPKPVADFTYPPVICEKQTPVTLVDNSLVPNALGNLTKWWWSIDGNISQLQVPPAFSVSTPGQVPAKIVVETAEGCRSDTFAHVLSIRYRPAAAFEYRGNLMCNNEIIHFKNLSSLPASAVPEFVQKWYWEFDNGTTSTIEHPQIVLNSGIQHATLVSETNYGCKSLKADTLFMVYPKPTIGLNISDSCILRTLRYNALDLSQTVDKWFWEFRSGLRPGPANLTRTYYAEGPNPLTLIGQTVYGCKDTLIRPFTIYDNKAFAGRDTIAAIDQPVLLLSHGGPTVQYTWTPAIGLDTADIENPTAILDRDQLYNLDAMSDKGCDAHSNILIKRFKGPELYIPNAFTPDKDGLNDILKVFPVGIKSFSYFAVYNRYGQQIFHTTDHKQGWNGKIKEQLAVPGNYVAVAKAIDYRGKVMQKSVNVILIR